MKLASLDSGRDGRLIVVTRNLDRATEAAQIAPTLQSALERWEPPKDPPSGAAGP